MNPQLAYLIEQGVPYQTLWFLLYIPVIVLLAVAFRQIVGMRGFGIYAPLLISFSFAILGLLNGLLMFFTVMGAGSLLRTAMGRVRILYLPRIGLILVGIVLAVGLLFVVQMLRGDSQFLLLAPFPLFTILILVESFLSAQIEKGVRAAWVLALETLSLTLVGYALLTWQLLTVVLFAYPWLSLAIVLAVLYGLGKWTGLRFTEYIRFREVIRHAKQ